MEQGGGGDAFDNNNQHLGVDALPLQDEEIQPEVAAELANAIAAFVNRNEEGDVVANPVVPAEGQEEEAPDPAVEEEQQQGEDNQNMNDNGNNAQANLIANLVQAVQDELGARMRISQQGREWALAIKRAIEADPEIVNLNDFCYVQLAVVCLDNVGEAVEKARYMQGLREEYNVRDNLEDAKKAVWECMDMFDNSFLLNFSYSLDERSYVATVDIAAIDHSAMKAEKAWRSHVVGMYYLKQAMIPEFQSMANGITIINECGGFDFYGKFGGLKQVSRLSEELWSAQPVLHRSVKFFNTGTSVTLMLSMIKRFLPKDLKNSLEFGCLFENRLDEVLLFPDPHTAKLRNFGRIMEALAMRYENEASFRL